MVIAVGLGIAVVNTLPSADGRLDVAWHHVPLLAALLVLLVPFYQGALLHLDAKYGRGTVRRHPTFVLLVDFVGLFFEAVVIVALATSVGDVYSFVICVAVLLAIDVVWATVAWQLDGESVQLGSWILVNLTTLVVLGLGVLVGVWIDYPEGVLTTAIMLVLLARSGVDYRKNWDFYGGNGAAAPTGSIASR